MIELLDALELCLLGSHWDESISCGVEAARAHPLLNEERGRAQLKEVVHRRAKMVQVLC